MLSFFYIRLEIMPNERSELHKRIDAGELILIVEVSPRRSADPATVRTVARHYAGRVHALGVSDNRDGVCMSALAAASLVCSEGVEPILHMVTRDRNRIALISDCLGAAALGIRNLFCTSGTHQTLSGCSSAKNVFDIDSTQLLQTIAGLASGGYALGEKRLEAVPLFCLGGVAAPYADPMEMHLMRLAKKTKAGAHFLITQPIFDFERFEAWWEEVSRRELDKKVAILGGVRVLTDAETATAYAARRPSPMVPTPTLERIASKAEVAAQRAEGISIAVETIQRLSTWDGLRGFAISGGEDDDAVLEVIEKSGLRTD